MIESSAHPVPDNAPETRLAELDGRLSAVERSSVDSWAVNGVRSDLSPDQWGVRVRHGLLPDGVYGYEMFTEDGKRCRNGHWAGEVFFFAGSTPPEGCEEANGGSVDGTTDTYLYLWRAIGTTYGGSGQSAFNKPNGRGRVIVGKATSGTFQTLGATGGAETDSTTLSVSNLPSHNHGLNSHTHGSSAMSVSGSPVAKSGHTHNVPVSGETTQSGTGQTVGQDGNHLSQGPSADQALDVSGSTDAATGNTANAGSGTSFSTSTLQPYLVLLPCIAL